MSNHPSSFDGARISEHAREQMSARRIDQSMLDDVLRQPDSVMPVRPGRVVVQKVVDFEPESRPYLVRVFIDIDRQPPEVVTAYRTSKIRKYMDTP